MTSDSALYEYAVNYVRDHDSELNRAMLYNLETDRSWPVMLGGGGKISTLPQQAMLALQDIPSESAHYIILCIYDLDEQASAEHDEEVYRLHPAIIVQSKDGSEETYWLEMHTDGASESVVRFAESLDKESLERLWVIYAKVKAGEMP